MVPRNVIFSLISAALIPATCALVLSPSVVPSRGGIRSLVSPAKTPGLAGGQRKIAHGKFCATQMALFEGGGYDVVEAGSKALQGAFLHLASHGHHAAHDGAQAAHAAQEVYKFNNPVLDTVFGSASSWGLILSAAVLLLGQMFESTVHFVEHNIPKAQRPVIKGVVEELATLGFVAVLVNNLSLGSDSSLLAQLSQLFFGEPEYLFEQFEMIDKGLFNVTVSFFAAFSVLLTVINIQFREWDRTFRSAVVQLRMAEDKARIACANDPNSDACIIAEDELLQRFVIDDDESMAGFFSSEKVRLSEFYSFRKRFVELAAKEGLPVTDDFRFYAYLEESAASDLKELVKIEPLQLVFALLPLAVVTVCNEALAKTFLGADNSQVGTLATFIISQLVILVWALWNYTKLRYVKFMIKPSIAKVNQDGLLDMLPPRYLHEAEAAKHQNKIINKLSLAELPFKAPAENNHEALFGHVGGNGPVFYLQSMKLLLFLSIVSFSYGTGLIGQDFGALTPWVNLALLPSIIAIVLAPNTFLEYNWATGVEALRDDKLVAKVLAQQREERFQTTLRTLVTIANKFNEVATSSEDLPERSYEEVEKEWSHLLETESPDTILELRDVFISHDPDGSGVMDEDEIVKLANELGFKLEGKNLETFINHLGSRKEFDFKEFATTFMRANNEKMSNLCSEEIGTQLFGFFNTDGNDRISEDEMLAKLRPLGFDAKGIEQLFLDVTGKSQRTISEKEFKNYLEKKVLVRA